MRKRDLEKLTTEVMQLRELLPRVLNWDLVEILHKAQTSMIQSHFTLSQLFQCLLTRLIRVGDDLMTAEHRSGQELKWIHPFSYFVITISAGTSDVKTSCNELF